MTAPDDQPDYGPLGGLLIPTLTGLAASGLFIAPFMLVGGNAWIVAPLMAFGGAALIGIVVGNPGNEAALLAGAVLPAAVLAVFEPHHACLGSVGLWIVLSFVTAIGLMFLGLIVGIIWGRGLGIRPLRPSLRVGVLAIADLVVVAGWIYVANRLATGSIC